MRALIYNDWNSVETLETPKPTPQSGEALIRVEACGICGSELETFRNRSPRRTPPLILGHEFCGVVETVGPHTSAAVSGDRIVANSVVSCRECDPCKRGDSNLCVNRKVFGMHMPGAIAEYVTVPEPFLYPRPPDLSPIMGAVVEPLANAVHLLRLLPETTRPTIAIMGAGAIGLLTLQAAAAMRNARTVIADIQPGRLKTAAALGAAMTIDPSTQDMRAACRSLSGSDGADISIDAVGSRETRLLSLRVVRPGGYAVWIGLHGEWPRA